MTKRQAVVRTVLFAALLCMVFVGCAAKRAQQAMNTERMLHAAGFKMKIADTPEKLDMLKELPQRKITPYPREGEMLYLYADAASCNCLYMGTAEAYQRFIEFRVGQGIAEDNRKAASANAAAASPVKMGFWGVWGPWW
jgi:hypothetical protein